jgi:cytochrome oxidase Cu insertion factor (SCO1/SenC/PrrC family)
MKKTITSKTTATKKAAVKKTADVIEHTFTDGTKCTGTIEQIKKVASALGMKVTGLSKVPKGYYMSESQGLVKVSEMNDHHIRRALVKRSKDYFTEIYSKDDTNKKFLQKYLDLTNDKSVVELFTELQKRG